MQRLDSVSMHSKVTINIFNDLAASMFLHDSSHL